MANIQLKAATRLETKKQVQFLRMAGEVPAVIYGAGKNHNIKINLNEFKKLYNQAGESTIIDLVIDGKETVPVLIHDDQRDIISDDFFHVDFYQIDMKKEIHANIDLHFVGESPAVKEMGGLLFKNLNKVEVKCLPADLVHSIEVDVNGLKTYADAIYVRDLKVSLKIKILTHDNVLVVKAVEPQKEEVVEVAAVAEPVEAAPTPIPGATESLKTPSAKAVPAKEAKGKEAKK